MSGTYLLPPQTGAPIALRGLEAGVTDAFRRGRTMMECAQDLKANASDVADVCRRLSIPMIDDRGTLPAE